MCIGTQALGPSFSHEHWEGAGLEAKQPGLEPMAQQEMPASYLTRCTTALEVLRPRPVLNTPDHSMGRASSQRSRRSSQEMLASAEHLRGRERRKQPVGTLQGAMAFLLSQEALRSSPCSQHFLAVSTD